MCVHHLEERTDLELDHVTFPLRSLQAVVSGCPLDHLFQVSSSGLDSKSGEIYLVDPRSCVGLCGGSYFFLGSREHSFVVKCMASLVDWCKMWGVCVEFFHSDREFSSRVIAAFCHDRGIHQSFAAANEPRTRYIERSFLRDASTFYDDRYANFDSISSRDLETP